MGEKRKFSRVPFRIETLITRDGESGRGEVADLSLRGMFVKTDLSANLEDTLQCSIYLMGASSELAINLTGKVVRIAADGLALSFGPMDLDSFIHIKNIVSYNSENADAVVEEFANFVKETTESRSEEAVNAWGKQPG